MVDLVPDRSNGSKKTSDNKRRGAPKVRTGCKTCKTRRVKCDEGKPECLRCTRAGYDCGGYGTTSVPCRRARNLLLPKSYEISSAQQRNIIQFPRTGVYIQPSSTPRFDTDIQREHFMFFQTRTAPELAGYFDSTVWNRKILQACHDQEYARHAVVALGALWKALDITQTIRLRNSSGVRKTQEAIEFYAFALREYGKALHLMKNIPSQPYPDRLRNTLMSSLLTTCFESYIGNQELALSQAEIGIDILLDYTNECQKAAVDDWTTMKTLENRSTFLDDDIVGMFARMDLQVMTFRDRNRTRYRTKAFPKVPVLFTSTNEARLYWDLIVRRVFVWHAQAHRDGSVPLDFAYSKEDKGGEIGSKEKKITDEAAEEARAFQKVTKNWYQAFLPMFEQTRHCPGTKDHLAASSLMLRFIRSRANLTSDPLDYVRLVDLAREILENDARSSTGKAVFTFETTVLVGLLIVVTACPQVAPRLESIELCRKYPRREGLVDSQMVMTIATWMLDQEENEVDGAIPEQSKLHIMKNEFDLKERRAVLHCAKGKDKIPLPPVTLYW